jgi:hypothetical protein
VNQSKEDIRENGANAKKVDSEYPAILSLQVENGQSDKLGPWALELVRLGRMFANSDPNLPITLALSLPILDFATSLIAAGFVAERAKRQFESAAGGNLGDSDRDSIFDQLCALPPGSSVQFRRSPTEMVLARFERMDEYEGQQYAVIPPPAVRFLRYLIATKKTGEQAIRMLGD